jgi:hypothetical protein
MLCQLPAVLALDPIQQPGQIVLGPLPRLHPSEPAGNPGMKCIELSSPARDRSVLLFGTCTVHRHGIPFQCSRMGIKSTPEVSL